MTTSLANVAVIGSGTMGAGIAEVAAAAGHPVLIYDIDHQAIARAIDGIARRLASRVEARQTGVRAGRRAAGAPASGSRFSRACRRGFSD